MSGDPRVTQLGTTLQALMTQELEFRDEPLSKYELLAVHLIEADRAAGIHRVKVDDETVERVARVLRGFTGDCACDEAYKGRDLIDPQCVYHYVPSEEAARAVLAALTGADS